MLASRERLWTERDVEQKLEALRQQVVHLSYVIEQYNKNIDGLNIHQHAPDGRLLVPMFGASADLLGYDGGRIPIGLRDKE